MDMTRETTADKLSGWDRRFYLGTHKPGWLSDGRFAAVSLFVSRRSLATIRKLPRALGTWALDSGGFTELQMHGRWTLGAREYAAEVRRFRDEIGGLAWAAPQDWMCEPQVIAGLRRPRKSKVARRLNEAPESVREIVRAVTGDGATANVFELVDDEQIVFAGTGLSVEEHQKRTVENFLELRSIAPDLPIIPVIQGWSIADYWRCEGLYRAHGVDLGAEPLVGVGTVCRRQGTATATTILKTLAAGGLRLHGFGFKTQGLLESAADLASADSLAWSVHARRRPPLPGHDQPGPGRRAGHINCANCADYALTWRSELLDKLNHADDGRAET